MLLIRGINLIICWLLLMGQVFAQGYSLLYENDFEKTTNFGDFEFTDPDAWRLKDLDGNKALELFDESKYENVVRSPFNIAVLKTNRVGSFTLEVDLLQTGKEYGHRDMCLFFGMKDPSNFYYVHMATKADQNAHNIFIVNDEDRRNIGISTTAGIDWGDSWQHVKITRDVETGTIAVFFNKMDKPIMEATDEHFLEGYIGFGSFDDTGMIDNIRLMGVPTLEKKEFFR